ncbi:MAG: class I SAM-dependent methyltransferase, partial [Pseudomonadota bacterium]
MDPVDAQYAAYPYPERDPADEAKRLITGSPSHPVEIDHFLFGGRRDWGQPFRALIAGGGTGDAAIMLAQLTASAGVPAEVVYLDRSPASRRIAEARAAARRLGNLRFETADLADAPGFGPFDYIDCCGVLHHLERPEEGLAALVEALSPEGGMGLMVYAPHGRAGVYEMQGLLRDLLEQTADPAERLAVAESALADLPPTHPLARNPFVADHKAGAAGVYDLLLSGRDRAYEIDAFLALIEGAGLRLAGFVEPARYDPDAYLRDPALKARLAKASPAERALFAERFAGNFKTHVLYVAPAARGETRARPDKADAIPVLHSVERGALARSIAKTGRLRFSFDGLTIERAVDRGLSPLVERIDGRRSLSALQAGSGLDWFQFQAAFGRLYAPLDGFNALRFSGFAAQGRERERE